MTLIQDQAESLGRPVLPDGSVATQSSGEATNAIQIVDADEALAAINEPDAELVIWARALPDGFEKWINDLDAANLPDTRLLVRPCDLRDAIDPILDECSMPLGDMRDFLLDDVDRLVTRFGAVTNSEFVDVRLERISHDACWKFHRDTVEARLITTYRGPATEWVQMADSERAIDEQTDYDGPLERLGDGHVALFKGKHAGQERGIVHRSPPIEGTGCTRLLLCLNKQTVVSPNPWERS